ncbi:DUF4168 domain-containing protein [Nitratireductor aquimarinus]|uniref:DUF4168 domain-containing protein n=1 Tax=Nitratireductor aquimarinus TaxID=889300 RepID=UPI001A8E30CB|nr:DUF4168 domain-containing protein [Nitratireductor aquimarinus]MBN8245442.1 DUF4168 domain-containing protein [Nitratireductor aquimarinus]MBY6133827.1 DUF4168 domain-containing protein [Nitratireductor aquimarinus]MCA1304914.1 DUF4168 domain-containing protein [Nitratireductor aquimarinus]
MILRTRLRTAATAIAFTASAAVFSPAIAQDAVPSPSPAPQAQTQSFDDQKLQAFTVAFLAVSDVKEQYTKRFQGASSDNDKQQVQAEATQQMEQAVEKTDGISVDEYNQIIQSAQTDEALAQKLNGMIGETAKARN